MTTLHDLLAFLDHLDLRGHGMAWVAVHTAGGHHGEPCVRVRFDSLLGWVAPPDCLAVGVVASGTAFALEAPAPPGGEAVRVTCLLDREGRGAGRAHFASGVVDEPPSGGLVLDTLRRCLVLPTDPPAVSPAVLVLGSWLSRIAWLPPRRRRRSWGELLALHPVIEVARSAGIPLGGPAGEEAVRRAGTDWTWEALRRQAAEVDPMPSEGGTRTDWLSVPPPLAAWMDEGMFCRFVLATHAEPHDLLELAEPLVSDAALARLDEMVSARAWTLGASQGSAGAASRWWG